MPRTIAASVLPSSEAGDQASEPDVDALRRRLEETERIQAELRRLLEAKEAKTSVEPPVEQLTDATAKAASKRAARPKSKAKTEAVEPGPPKRVADDGDVPAIAPPAKRRTGQRKPNQNVPVPPVASDVQPEAPSDAASSSAPAITEGCRVRLHGLQALPELNGVCGVTCGYDFERGRWEVQLDGDFGSKHVKVANLELAPMAENTQKSRAKASQGKAKQPRKPAVKHAVQGSTGEPSPPKKKRSDAAPPSDVGESKSIDNEARHRSDRASLVDGDGQASIGKSIGGADDVSCATPFRHRLRGKTAAIIDESPVAVLLRRLAEDDSGDKLGMDASRVANAEMDAKDKGDDEELEGEKRVKRRTGRPKKAAAAAAAADLEADDDKLFDEDDELEGEEDFSEMSDEGVSDDEEDDGDIACEAWRPVDQLPWPNVWSCSYSPPEPGTKGFNAYASQCIARAGLGGPSSPFTGLGMRLHQESAAFLVHPTSPMKRLLVDHATGTGKTLIMLRILDNYFDDPRPKVAIFPKERVCDNFYQELLKWPSRWRHYFAFCRPNEAILASGVQRWWNRTSDVWDLSNERIRAEARKRGVRLEKVIRELIEVMKTTLEMKNAVRQGKIRSAVAKKFLKEHANAPVPRSPLRAFRYTTAGGAACELGEDGWPRSPLLKVGFDQKDLNPYTGKIVIMDECHNLVRPTQKYEEQLGRLRDHLYGARSVVLAGFTGTPVGNDAREGRRLLDVIKGEGAAHKSDEGFVSSFHARGSADFPREEPVKGIPDGILHEGMIGRFLKKHSLHGEALKRYLMKEVDFQIIPRLVRLPPEKRVAKLANYCNLHVHYGSFYGIMRDALMKNVKDHAPKMHAIIKSVQKNQEKAVVMISREMGYRTFCEVMRRAGKKAGFKMATLDELSDFNDPKRNLRGERFRVLVAETSQAGEGVQFKHVRRVYLLDVPLRHSDLIQRTSRCVRLGGHADLPTEERTIAIEQHVATLPKFLRNGPTALIYRELLNARDVGTGIAIEAATLACQEELKRRGIKTLMDLQQNVQADDGDRLIELLTETVLEQLGDTSTSPARPMSVALWRLRRGGDDIETLETALQRQVETADELLVDELMDKSAELLPPLEAMRWDAVDRQLLAPLGDPPRAPSPRSEAVHVRCDDALTAMEPDLQADGATEMPAQVGEIHKEDDEGEEPEEDDDDADVDLGDDGDDDDDDDDEDDVCDDREINEGELEAEPGKG